MKCNTIATPAAAPATSPADLLTVEAFAQAVSLHPESVRRAIRRGSLQAVKVGRLWRIPARVHSRVCAEGLPA